MHFSNFCVFQIDKVSTISQICNSSQKFFSSTIPNIQLRIYLKKGNVHSSEKSYVLCGKNSRFFVQKKYVNFATLVRVHSCQNSSPIGKHTQPRNKRALFPQTTNSSVLAVRERIIFLSVCSTALRIILSTLLPAWNFDLWGIFCTFENFRKNGLFSA